MLKIGYLSFFLFFFMGLLYFLYKYNLTSKTIGEKLERNEWYKNFGDLFYIVFTFYNDIA